MDHKETPSLKGQITQRFDIWCGGCPDHLYLDSGIVKRTSAFAAARKKGWKYTKEYGWICPICIKCQT